ncbi:MAG: hypothetical protein QGI78_01325 [Phycisphaerales bacterium]|jgi:hypothetical protein|nr:hypothetical protein [Phycisphaerales bacterium]
MKIYLVRRNGTDLGTFTKRQIKRGILENRFKHTDVMQADGSETWIRLGDVSKLSGLFKDEENENPHHDPTDPLHDSFVIDPDSADQTGFGTQVVDPAASSVDLETDRFDDSDSEDESVDQDPPIDAAQAQSDLRQATVFATQNFLRRSLFMNNADSIQKYGLILQYLGLISLGLFTFFVQRNSPTSPPYLQAASWAVAIVIGGVAAAKCRFAGQRLVASTPTSVRGPEPLSMLGLMILVGGLALLTGVVLLAFFMGEKETEDSVWIILYGILGLLATILASGLVLSPSVTNVEIETVSSTEEGFGLIALVAKAGILVSPFVLASCAAVGLLRGLVATYHLWQNDGVVVSTNMSGWEPSFILFLVGGFYPLVMYFVLLVYTMFERMFR